MESPAIESPAIEIPAIESPGIIPWIVGGLGNQIFIVIAAWLAAKRNSCPMYLLQNPHSNNKHSSANYKESVFKHIGIHKDDEYSDQTMYRLLSNGYKIVHQNLHAFSQYSLDTDIPAIYKNYFQYYPPMKDHENEIRSLLLGGLFNYPTFTAFNAFTVFENDAFLHIRRGDYVPLPHVHPLCPLSYYKDALSRLHGLTSVKYVHVLSDDMDWVQRQSCWAEFTAEFGISFYFHKLDELSTLALMSCCKGGAICANSSFSWWGAFLGAYSVRAPVFVPKRWIPVHPQVALFPEEWTVLDVSD